MGRAPCCTKVGLHRGPWTAREDRLLTNYIHSHGEGHWRSLPKNAGLLRCGKSCRLRWMNYLRPGIKRGNITPDEDDLIIRLHSLLGNRWSLIAGRLPGRTDNEIKNYWNSHLSKRFKEVNDQPRKVTGKKIPDTQDQESENGETIKKVKIHQPKAVRVSSVLLESRNTSTIGGFDYDQGWKEDENGAFCGFVSSSTCQSIIPGNDDGDNMMMLDEIFDEYDQLFKNDENGRLDSFIESLLV